MDADEQLMRLLRIHHEHGGLTVACDFDNTLFDFHYEREKHLRQEYDLSEIHSLLVRLKAAGCYIIIWTASEDDAFVKRFLAQTNIPYDALNENPPFFKGKARKIYYNVLLDDAAGLRETYQLLTRFLNQISQPTP